ncbi:MAG: HAD family hydrolase [Candidatus Marinimicrobia bacterium]|jgi:heptosyltransferase-2|nr:HAD family hydrolase [Candidatus Neomarinimicrobiota bacterium]MDP6612023.1 HAD family hydrolase [Candidatus Neomarinimicrobiota bacterium]|tara:strand:- start:3138 stop:3680 length:543 start_codon:yes stop_codon:yes gene_type:complete
MKKYDTIFLDRDGTLNPDPGYINSLAQFAFYDFTLEALKELGNTGNRFCIVTNQSGIARGIVDLDTLSEIHSFILNQFYENGLDLLGIYFCPDHPEEASEFRKPGSGMFRQASDDHGIVLSKSLMIGDAVSDIKAGVNSGMDTMLVLTGRGQQAKADLDKVSPTYIANDLLDGANQLLAA